MPPTRPQVTDARPSRRRITLVRHGRPDLEAPWIVGGDFEAWWARYNEAGITDDSHPPGSLADELGGCDLLVTSTLPRAQASLTRLVPEASPRVDARFCEIDIPALPVPALHLPAAAWSFLGRVAWLARVVDADESVRGARSRVGEAARSLTRWSDTHPHIGVVAHGYFNLWLTEALRAEGWSGGYGGTPFHWSAATLHRPEPSESTPGADRR